jgi:Uma2 family endonuclease
MATILPPTPHPASLPPAPPQRTRAAKDLYPASDGKPMGETDHHVLLIAQFVTGLRARYAGRPDVYVAGNNFIYYEEGNPKARVSPDTYVVFGADREPLRRSFFTWKEGGKMPGVVFEFTSRSTRREDLRTKRPLYETVLKVPEYFLFDPEGEWLRPRLQGFRLGPDGRYVALPLVNDRLYSEQLSLDLVLGADTLRLFDPARGAYLPTLTEAEQRAEAETQRADAAEAEIARLRAQLNDVLRQQQEHKENDAR